MFQDTHEIQDALGEFCGFWVCFFGGGGGVGCDHFLNERRKETALTLLFSAVKVVTLTKSITML